MQIIILVFERTKTPYDHLVSKSCFSIVSHKLGSKNRKWPALGTSWYLIHGSFWDRYWCALSEINPSSWPTHIWTEPSLLGKGFEMSMGSNSQFPNPTIASLLNDSPMPCCCIFSCCKRKLSFSYLKIYVIRINDWVREYWKYVTTSFYIKFKNSFLTSKFWKKNILFNHTTNLR